MSVVAIGRIGWFVASVKPEHELLLAWAGQCGALPNLLHHMGARW